MNILCLTLVKQISVPPTDTASAVSFSKDLSQTSSSAEALSDPKEQVKGPSEEKKKKDKTEKKGNKSLETSACSFSNSTLHINTVSFSLNCSQACNYPFLIL